MCACIYVCMYMYIGCIYSLRIVPTVCHSCLDSLHYGILYSPSTREFHGGSRPAKNSCRPSNRSISLEICYFHLQANPDLLVTVRQVDEYLRDRRYIVNKYGRGLASPTRTPHSVLYHSLRESHAVTMREAR